MKLDELVSANYDKLNKNDLTILKYINNNKEECSNLSIEALAKKCDVSRTTIMRFSQKLSLKGFGELKALLHWEINEIKEPTEDIVNVVCDNIIDVINSLRERNMDNICKLLYEARNIYVYGTGSLQRDIARRIKHIFLHMDIFVLTIEGENDFFQALRTMQKDDVVIMISSSGESESAKNLAIKAKSKGIPIVSLTKLSSNTLSYLSDYNLYVNTSKVKTLKNLNYEIMVMFYILIEVLYLKFIEYSAQVDKSDNS